MTLVAHRGVSNFSCGPHCVPIIQTHPSLPIKPNILRMRFFPVVSASALVLSLSTVVRAEEGQISFTNQIKPLLSDRCFKCHGLDTENQESSLRLDTEEHAKEDLGGYFGIVPGNLEKSLVHQRMHTTDPDILMPPPESNLSLTPEEKKLIDDWIMQGAKYEKHWSFEPVPETVEVPTAGEGWALNEIDRFVAKTFEEKDLTPAKDASPEKWLRRVTFDLTGLPPTTEELDAFLADPSESKREEIVNRLLASDAYAERMTTEWLDVARYSDSYGYQRDHERMVWPWRDWVIKSFQENKPYSTFITEQLAGDLLPDATQDQKLATAFNRLHGHCMEGGSVLEEYRCEYVADRTETVSTAFLGLTMQCAKCHDHKYDPITAKDVYSFGAFFSNIDESGVISYFTDAVPTPSMPLFEEGQKDVLEQKESLIRSVELDYQAAVGNDKSFTDWLNGEKLSAPTIAGEVGHYTFEEADSDGRMENLVSDEGHAVTKPANTLVEGKIGKGILTTGDDEIDVYVGDFGRADSFSFGVWAKPAEITDRANILSRGGGADDAASMGYELILLDGKPTVSLIHFWPGDGLRVQAKEPISVDQWAHLAFTYDGSSKAAGVRIYVNGVPVETEILKDTLTRTITDYRGDWLTDRQYLALGQRYRDRGFKGGVLDEFRVFNRQLSDLEIKELVEPNSLAAVLAKPSADLSETEVAALRNFYTLAVSPEASVARQRLTAARLERNEFYDSIPAVSIMKEMPGDRPDFVLERGAYDAKGEPVESETPHALPPMSKDMPKNRLGLAQWLTSEEQPLTSRVTVNRYWQMIFGVGIVKTSEDFGNQGTPPTHPELLDWLARDFMANDWDLHHLLKQMVLSKTYRQSTETTPENRSKDPENLYLSWSHPNRLPAEMIRDNALAVSGLLVNRIGGEPTKPYDVEVSFVPTERDKGENLYRRSVYHWWKRNAASPVLTAFDVPKRDICTVKREVTSSPLQALIMLNNPQIMEAARVFAANLWSTDGATPEQIVTEAFRSLTSRMPNEKEVQILTGLYESQLSEYQADLTAAQDVISIGDASPAENLDAPKQAATTIVVNAIMNLDDSLTER